MPDSLFTFDALATLAGASLLTYLVVSYTKTTVDKIKPGLPTDLYAVSVATLVLVAAQLATGANPVNWRVYALALANGFLTAAAAGKMNDAALRPPGSRAGADEGK